MGACAVEELRTRLEELAQDLSQSIDLFRKKNAIVGALSLAGEVV
jgi:hypothetical protein